MRSCLLKYRHLFYGTFQPLLPPFNSCAVVETKVTFKIVIIRAISEKRNRPRLAWFDMIIIEQSYLFRRGFTKEIFVVYVIEILLKWQEHWFCTYFALFSWCNGGERGFQTRVLWMKLLQLRLEFYENTVKTCTIDNTLSYLKTTHWASNRSYRLVTNEQNDSHYKQCYYAE